MPTRKKTTKKSPKRWIQAALSGSKPGALHRQLGVRVGSKIPLDKLKTATKAPGKLGRRARLAMTLRKLSAKRKRRA